MAYPTVRKFSLEFDFRCFANGKLLYLNAAYYYIFESLSIIAYMTEIQKTKFANI